MLIHEGELTKLCRKVPKKVHLAFLCVCTVALSADLLYLSFSLSLQRYFFLFNDLLLYGVANPLNRTYIIHRTISLLAGRIIPVDDSDKVKNGFKIISKGEPTSPHLFVFFPLFALRSPADHQPEKSFLVWADTPEEKLSWTAKIEAGACPCTVWSPQFRHMMVACHAYCVFTQGLPLFCSKGEFEAEPTHHRRRGI